MCGCLSQQKHDTSQGDDSLLTCRDYMIHNFCFAIMFSDLIIEFLH